MIRLSVTRSGTTFGAVWLTMTMTLVACGRVGVPTEVPTSASTRPVNDYVSGTALTFTYPDAIFSLDTANAVARLTSTATGDSMFTELNANESAQIAQMLLTIDDGSEWTTATASLNPLENAPPGWLPQLRAAQIPSARPKNNELTLDELMRLARTHGRLHLDGIDSTRFIVKVKSVRKAKDNEVLAQGLDAPPSLTDLSSSQSLFGGIVNLVDYPQYEDCVSVAQSIALQRAAFMQSRDWVSTTTKNVAKGQLLNYISRFGRNFVEGPDVVQAFLNVGMSGAEAAANSITLGVKVSLYNKLSCQGLIAIRQPIPPRIFTGGGSEQISKCEVVVITYQMSVDGGVTWFDVDVPGMLCNTTMMS